MTRLRLFEKMYRKVLVRMLGARAAFQVDFKLGRVRSAILAPFRKIERPIFLWGAGRTGSFLLYDIVSMHDGVVCPRSFDRLNDGLYGHHHHGRGKWNHILDNPFPPIEGAKRFILTGYPDIAQAHSYPAAQIKALRDGYRRLAAGTWRRRRLLDKAPHYTFLIPLLETLFPDALHVHCVRDPTAVARSYYRRMCEPGAIGADGIWGAHPKDWQRAASLPLPDRATWLAVHTMMQGLENEQRLGARCLRVAYEEVTASPKRVVARVLKFLQLPHSTKLMDKLPEKFENYNKAAMKFSLECDEMRRELSALCQSLSYPAESCLGIG